MRNPKWHRDEIILALNLYFDENRGPIVSSNPKIISLSDLMNVLPIHLNRPDEERFRNANGVTLKLTNFLALDPNYDGKGMVSFSKLDEEVFNEFSKDIPTLRHIAEQIIKISKDSNFIKEINEIGEDEITALDKVQEGQILYKLHKVRERNPKIIAAKKRKVLQENGFLRCEACGFDFEQKYGAIGKGFIECHHIEPLSKFDTNKVTSINDLVLLCSNCHQMIHRKMAVEKFVDFKKIISNE